MSYKYLFIKMCRKYLPIVGVNEGFTEKKTVQ